MRRRLALGCVALVLAGSTIAATEALAGGAERAPAQQTGVTSAQLRVRHVFVIVLENKSFDEAYDPATNTYLSTTLESQGTLLTHYFGVAHLSNPNYIAMVSGQGPNPLNQSDCQDYVDFQPSPAVFAPDGQAVGQGCVFPADVKTLPDQLSSAGLTWRGYMQDMGNDTSREPAHCGEPTSSSGTGMQDGTQSATATDQYAARHNPFVYFHSLLDSGACHADVLPLGSPDPNDPKAVLSKDLVRTDTTANFSFIAPDLCNDGHDAPCADGGPGGLAAVNSFLRTWVPLIERSPAFASDGLLVITTDESEWNQSQQDSSSCCGERPGPNSPLPGITGPGGGRTGALVIGRCVARGVRDDTPYNHYSLLRSLEDVFGIHEHLGYAGADGVAPFGPDVFSRC